MHHPIVLAVVAWWALNALVLQLGSGAVTVAVVSLIGQSLAVVLLFQLNKRAQRTTDEKLRKQNKAQAKFAAAVQDGIAKAQLDAVKSQTTADATHAIVNSRYDEMQTKLDAAHDRISTLERERDRQLPATEGA